jgi:sigma-54 dependent transcriptional regulator, acetoin dehydrogenase operon transcriptional activator AcoR
VATMAATAPAGHPQLDGVLRHFVGSVTVPALRHHVDDLQQLLPHLLRKLAPRRPVACTPGAMRVLLGYNWPGNVTELRDVLRGADQAAGWRPARSRSSREMFCFQSP